MTVSVNEGHFDGGKNLDEGSRAGTDDILEEILGDIISGGTASTAHHTNHLPGGSDALHTAAPAATGVATAAAEGAATSFARSDHAHRANTAPADVTKAAAAIGTSGEPARADHKHDITTAAPAAGSIAEGAVAAEGSATSLARSDHVHPCPATYAPSDHASQHTVNGSDELIKHGRVVAAGAEDVVVTFGTAYGNTNYSITGITFEDTANGAALRTAYVKNATKAVGGFTLVCSGAGTFHWSTAHD